MIPIAGSAYTYTYATMGELIAWIIGWDLILEYAVSNMAVSVGFAAHMAATFNWFGYHPALRWITPAYLPGGLTDLQGNVLYAPGWHFGFNHRRIPDRAPIDRGFGARYPRVGGDQQHHGPAEDRRHTGICFRRHALHSSGKLSSVRAGRMVGSAHRRLDYLLYVHRLRFCLHRGRRSAQSSKRDILIGIIATLIVCTILYLAVAVVLTGLVPWHSLLDDAAPVVNSMSMLAGTTKSALLHWTELAVLFGAMMGMISSLLVFQLGQARVWFSMSRDGLLPKIFGRVHPRFRTPAVATWIAEAFSSAFRRESWTSARSLDLSNIGTLFAFVLVSIGVIILRYKTAGASPRISALPAV